MASRSRSAPTSLRRAPVLAALVLVSLIAAPVPAAHAAAPSSVTVVPATDTVETGTPFSPSIVVRDAAGSPVPGTLVDVRVVAGGHASKDLDGSPMTPPGFIGVCETNQSGFCSITYTGSDVTVDTVRALVDFDHDGVTDSGEPAATGSVDWRAPGAGPSKIRLDMSGCDGDTSAPVDGSTWNLVGPTTEVGGSRPVCAARFNASDALAAGPVTFVIIDGPGVFTGADGSQSLGTVQRVDPASGVNRTWIRSTVSGITRVRVELGSIQVAGQATWKAAAPRAVALTPPAQAVAGSERDVVAVVSDRYGNPAPGVGVTFSTDGVGGFKSGTQTVTATTSLAGAAVAVVKTDPGEAGTQTVSATISPSSTECAKPAQDPAGAPAGVCLAEADVRWVEGAPDLSIAVTPAVGVWGTAFAVTGLLRVSGAPIPGKLILVYGRPVGAGPRAWTQFTSTTTDETGRYTVVSKPAVHSEYFVAFGGDEQFTSAVSSEVRASVRLGIHMNQSHAALPSGQAVTFRGRILPEHAHALVMLQQLTPAGWRTIATTRSDAGAWYSFRVVKRSPGGLLFRTVAPSDFDHLWNASLNRRVDWR